MLTITFMNERTSHGDKGRGMLDLKLTDMRFMYLTELRGKAKTLRYSVYRDGCFYPYYGKLEIIE